MAKLLSDVPSDRGLLAGLLDALNVEALYTYFGVPLEPNGEQYLAYCPWHHDQGRPNLSVSPQGLYHCFACGAQGGVLDFIAHAQRAAKTQTWDADWRPERWVIADAIAFAREFPAIQDTIPTERHLDVPDDDDDDTGPHYVPAEYVLECEDALWHHPQVVEFLTTERGIGVETLRGAMVGYDDATRRVTIPVFDRQCRILNVRRYRPHAPKGVPKVLSYAKGYGRNRRLNPWSGGLDWSGPILILAGEMDWLLALSLGYRNADTFTAGEGTVPSDDLIQDWHGQDVYLWYDNDPAGRRGAQAVAERLKGVCRPGRPHIVGWPDGFPEGDDFTDLVVKHGATRPQLDALIAQAHPI